MIALGLALVLAAANTCLYSSLARGYEGQLGRWTDLALLAGGFLAFLVGPLMLADRWITRRRRFLHTVDGPKALLKALLAWNAVGAAAFGALTPRAELQARARWLPSRLAPGLATPAGPRATFQPIPSAQDGEPPTDADDHAPAVAVRTPKRPGSFQPWGLSTFQENARAAAAVETRRAEPTRAAVDMLGYINAARRSRGAPELRFDPVLTRIAQDWAELLAQRQVLSHHVRGALGGHPHPYSEHYPPGWRGAAENVGFAVSVQQIFRGMYHEEQDAQGRCLEGRPGGHCRNILDPRLNSIGIGDVVKDGYHWNVQNFATY